MSPIYMVSGSNLFGQWLTDVPILEKFVKMLNIQTKKFKLIHVSWSYNVFQYENELYVCGSWDNNENVVKKLDLFSENEFKSAEFKAAGNDDCFYLLDTTTSKLWILHHQLDKMSTFHTLDLEFNSLGNGEKEKNDMKVSKMIISNKTVHFLTNKGCVFTGIPPTYVDTSHCLGNVIDIACGYEHCMLLTDIGHVYTWGSGKRFQLGHGNIEDCATPQEVDALAGIKITKIAAGAYHCLALSEFGDAFSWGWNDDGQLGVFDNLESQPSFEKAIEYSLPNLISVYDENGDISFPDVVDIACGSKHSALKQADNTVWTCGSNEYGQLGLSTKLFPCAKYFRKVYKSTPDFNMICAVWSTVIEI